MINLVFPSHCFALPPISHKDAHRVKFITVFLMNKLPLSTKVFNDAQQAEFGSSPM